MMNSIADALKSVGFNLTEEQKENKIKLPFTDSTFGYTEEMLQDNIEFIKNNMFRITRDELDNMHCKKDTENIKNLLQRNFDKLYAIEDLPIPEYGTIPGLYIYFVYSYILGKFEVVIDHLFEYDITKILEDNNIPPMNLNPKMEKRLMPLAFHIANHCDSILLYIKDKRDSLLYYPDIPFKFSKIQEDKKAMAALKPFLEKQQFQPNPNKYYFIKESQNFDSDLHMALTGKPLYYLKKATKEEIEKAEENRNEK